MVIEMERQQFESLGDVELFMACTEPTIEQIRGRSLSAKTATVSALNPGQQALCMFRVLYPASGSESDYRVWLKHLLEQPGYWKGVVSGLEFLEETELLRLLEETKEVLEDSDHSRIAPLFARFRLLLPNSMTRIGDYIRANASEFVHLHN